MIYDFDTPVARFGTDSSKWQVKEGELPLTVADMDFRTCPEVVAALAEKVKFGVFGYSEVPDEWYAAYARWWKTRHGLDMDRDALIFCTGVVAAISSTVRKLTTPNENVVVQTPVYNIFFNSIVNNGCRPLESPLAFDGERYSMDLDDLEKKLSDPQTNLMILCNPHNPVGRIWSADDLAKVGALAKKYGVTVISDELHCDVTEPGRSYVPFASVSDECREVCVACIGASKAFNLAGIQSAAVYVPNGLLRNRIRRALNTDEVAEPNSFATAAVVAALSKGGDWLDQMRGYISLNRKFAGEFIARELPEYKAVGAEATYLMWLYVGEKYPDDREFVRELREKTGLVVSPGSVYGAAGKGFVRLNLACPRSVLEDALSRLKAFR